MPAMVGWVRLLVVGRKSGRWSVRGGVPTLERGNDPPQILLMLPCRGVGGWPRREGGSGQDGFPGKKSKRQNSRICFSLSLPVIVGHLFLWRPLL